MTKPTVFNYKNHEELRQAYKELLADNQQLTADNRKLRKEVTELKQLNDGYVKIIAKNQETNNKLMASVQKQTGGDYINRADAIEAVASRDSTDGHTLRFTGREITDILSALPSADAVHGEWIRQGKYFQAFNETVTTYKCSVCGHEPYFGGDISKLNYCPSCGARMKGGADK